MTRLSESEPFEKRYPNYVPRVVDVPKSQRVVRDLVVPFAKFSVTEPWHNPRGSTTAKIMDARNSRPGFPRDMRRERRRRRMRLRKLRGWR